MSRTTWTLLLVLYGLTALAVPVVGFSLPPCFGNAEGQVSAECLARWQAALPLFPQRFVEVLGVPMSAVVTILSLLGITMIVDRARSRRGRRVTFADTERAEMATPEGSVWIMWHVPPGGDADKSMLIGVYSSRDAALAAVARLADKPGFRDNPTVTDDEDGPGFFMQPYPVDADHWAEGYRVARDGDYWQPLPAWLQPDSDE